jgi:hypothetical protein
MAWAEGAANEAERPWKPCHMEAAARKPGNGHNVAQRSVEIAAYARTLERAWRRKVKLPFRPNALLLDAIGRACDLTARARFESLDLSVPPEHLSRILSAARQARDEADRMIARSMPRQHDEADPELAGLSQ